MLLAKKCISEVVMESIWRKTCDIKSRPKLLENKKTQALVIGAGMSGILTAYQLERAGGPYYRIGKWKDRARADPGYNG